MDELRQRRSCRLAMSIPIRVYGTDYKGRDFVEDTSTVVVNQHGAKIRMIRQLLPEQEIHLLSQTTRQEALFRVVAKVVGSDGQYNFWGIECLDSEENIWGVRFPEMGLKDQAYVRLMVECPVCLKRDVLYLDEPMLEFLRVMGGITRGCLVCGNSGLWRPIPYQDS